MGASTKAFYLAAAGCGIAVGGIKWYFDLDWSFETFLLIWGAATLVAWPGVLQDMANERIVDGDPPPPEPEMRPGYWPQPPKQDTAVKSEKAEHSLPGGEDIERGFGL